MDRDKMKPFKADLFALVQCPANWFWYVLLSLVFLISFFATPDEGSEVRGRLTAFLMISFWSGAVVSCLTKEIMTRAFTFCLPRSADSRRDVILWTGAVLNLILALLYATRYGPADAAPAVSVLSAAAMGLAGYLAGVLAVISFRNATVVFFLPLGTIPLADNLYPRFFYHVGEAACRHPFLNGALAGLLLFVAWRLLGRRSMHRRHCGSAFLPIQSMWSKGKIDRFNKQVRIEQLSKAPRLLWKVLDRCLLNRMLRRRFLSRSRYFQGIHYAISGQYRPVTVKVPLLIVFCLLGMTVLFGYFPPWRDRAGISCANALFLIPCIIGLFVPLPVFSTLLLPAGRRDKFWCTLYIGVRVTLFAAGIGLLFFLLSVVARWTVPDITLGGETHHYLSMEAKTIFLPALMIPVLYMIQLIFPRRHLIPQCIFLIIACTVTSLKLDALSNMETSTLTVLLGVAWGFFVLTARHRCLSTDLVLQ